MIRPILFLLPVLFVLSHSVCAQDAAETESTPPNVLIFLTDDQGWGDLGCYGHPEIKSPHLDAFAKEGMRFTQCYAGCSVCSPSRAAILTGRTPYRNGVWRWIPSGSIYHLRESEITLPEQLKNKGYATCHAGKWHLNGHFNSDEHPQPDDHGYDWWLATQNNASPHHLNPKNYVRNGEETGVIEGPSAVIAAQEAAAWLENEKPDDTPFFITVWTHEPHLPIESAEKYMAHYKHIDDEGIRQHHGNITQLDAAFGVIVNALERLGHADNTFVFFTSDNGPEGAGNRGRTRGSTGGLRGRKRATHEGGIRVPGIARWPGKIPAGSTCDTPVIGQDLFATVLDILDVPLPDDRVIDGASILPLFADAEAAVIRTEPLYWRNHLAKEDSRIAIRDGDWKIIGADDHSNFELYNIADDWQETTNLAETHPDKFAAMRQRLIDYDKAVLADGPDWWKADKQKKPNTKKKKPNEKKGPKANVKGAALPAGEDTTGTFAVTKGGTVTKDTVASDDALAVVLAAKGEGFAVRELDTPAKQLTLSSSFQTRNEGNTRNAFLVFGDAADNNALVKVGTAIGMGSHAVFQGDWSHVGGGATRGEFEPRDRFDVTADIDLETRTLIATINGAKLTAELPKSLKQVTHVGVYAKGTKSAFGPVKVTDHSKR